MTRAEAEACLDVLALEAQQRIDTAERIAAESRGALLAIDAIRRSLASQDSRAQRALDERDSVTGKERTLVA